MELEVLKKKLGTYRNARGQVRNVPDELLLEVLTTWERWTGTTPEFYRGIGISHAGMASMMGKAKKLKREGRTVSPGEFTEVTAEMFSVNGVTPPASGIELSWSEGKVIRFGQVDQLLEFLKKAA
jgi:hypothetical protein